MEGYDWDRHVRRTPLCCISVCAREPSNVATFFKQPLFLSNMLPNIDFRDSSNACALSLSLSLFSQTNEDGSSIRPILIMNVVSKKFVSYWLETGGSGMTVKTHDRLLETREKHAQKGLFLHIFLSFSPTPILT